MLGCGTCVLFFYFPCIFFTYTNSGWTIYFNLGSLLIEIGLTIIRKWVFQYQATEFVQSFKVGGLRLLQIMQWE